MTDTLETTPPPTDAAPTAPTDPASSAARPWWQRAVVYQVWPRSFADSDGDGVGDLRGIIDHLDHLSWLGVDVVWLSPIYPSPQDDLGYDISDYQDVEPVFGTLADLDDLLDAAHDRGLRVVLDLVVNHTSDEHPWFRASRSSREDPKRDWYVWRDLKPDGSPPNNWSSRFSGPAWAYDEATEQSYLHLFSAKQPDLSWDNPEVRQAVFAMMRWWLDRGVDGFRMDVINFISKTPGLPDDEPLPGGGGGDGRRFYLDGPRLADYLTQMRREVFDGRDDKVLITVGETPGLTVDRARVLTDPDSGALNMVFQFEHVQIDHDGDKWHPRPFDVRALKASMARWQDGLADGGWNSLYLNNHDQPRVVSRWGDDGAYRTASATALATVLHLHRGTPYVYQGEEIGMGNVELGGLEDLLDVASRNRFRAAQAADADLTAEQVMATIRPMARDNARSPVQWDAGPQAGFTTGRPWMPVNPDHTEVNVAAQRDDPGSVLQHYRALIALRHERDLVASGSCTLEALEDRQLYVIRRRLGDQEGLMVANLSGEPATVPVEVARPAGLLLASSNRADSPGSADALTRLRPWEAVVYLSPAHV